MTSDIILARPLREFMERETLHYMHINSLDKFIISRRNLCLEVKGRTAALPGKGNFNVVIDEFLTKLHVLFL